MLLHLDSIDSKLPTHNQAVGGTIYLQIGDTYFPEENWYDYASHIFEHWFPVILSFSRGITEACDLTFWDGPCCAILRRNADSIVTVECVYNKKTEIPETVIDFPVFVNSVVKAGTKYCRLLYLQGRSNENISKSVQCLKHEMRTD